MSIQYSLSGLSFFGPGDCKKHGPVSDEEFRMILHKAKEESGIEKINIVVNTDRFVVVPAEIYDQDYEKDYLYTKNIVCGEEEVIMSSSIGAAVVIFPVDGRLLSLLEKEVPEVKTIHALVPCLSAAYRSMEKTKKHVLLASMSEGVFAYAVVGKKTLLAADCTADGGVAKAGMIMGLLDDKFGLSRGVVLLDDGGILAGEVKRTAGKMSLLSNEEYLGIIDEDSKR